MNYDFSNMGENIACLRRRIGMTQEMLAYRLGVTSQAVSKWERQISCPDVSLLPVMAEIFGVSIDDLFVQITPAANGAILDGLPWDDDGQVRVAVFEGRRLCVREVYECPQDQDMVLLIHHGDGRHSMPLGRPMTGRAKTPPE